LKARQLYEAGKLGEAIGALSDELRNDPTNVRQRTFLFELLCFAGEYDRAGKQLEVIAGSSKEAEMGAWLYRSALHAERTRQEKFDLDGPLVIPPAASAVTGTLNGNAFSSIVDADPRVGARLEVFAAGQYTWIPFRHVASIAMEPPQRLRDLLWSPARVMPGDGFEELELGEVLLPALAAGSWRGDDDEVRLGRVTDFVAVDDEHAIPVGQKLLLVDGEPFPFLELRELVITPAASEA
jgi:type VI secretion system protein ImpE